MVEYSSWCHVRFGRVMWHECKVIMIACGIVLGDYQLGCERVRVKEKGDNASCVGCERNVRVLALDLTSSSSYALTSLVMELSRRWLITEMLHPLLALIPWCQLRWTCDRYMRIVFLLKGSWRVGWIFRNQKDFAQASRLSDGHFDFLVYSRKMFFIVRNTDNRSWWSCKALLEAWEVVMEWIVRWLSTKSVIGLGLACELGGIHAAFDSEVP